MPAHELLFVTTLRSTLGNLHTGVDKNESGTLLDGIINSKRQLVEKFGSKYLNVYVS